MNETYTRECRYCDRYRRACGRTHTAATAADWSRDWQGNPRLTVAAIVAETDPMLRPCEGCNAAPGEPCRWGCLSNAEQDLEPDPTPATYERAPVPAVNIPWGQRFAALAREHAAQRAHRTVPNAYAAAS